MSTFTYMRYWLAAQLLIIFLSSCTLEAQRSSLFLSDERDVVIPFEYDQEFIIVEAVIDGRVKVRLLVDTGSEFTIIFSKFLTDLMGLEYYKQIDLLGSDLSRKIKAHISERVSIGLGKNASVERSLLVLENGSVQMDKMLGMEIDGILGAEVFKAMLCHIDYGKKKLRISRPTNLKRMTKRHQAIPTLINSNKAHIYTALTIDSVRLDSILLLLDTGSAIPFMVHDDTLDELVLPEDLTTGVLGIGLGGYVKGYKGRIEKLEIDELDIEDVVTNFHSVDSLYSSQLEFLRNGLLGNRFLQHMDPIIDYSRGTVYFRPNIKALKKSKHDRSGLFVIAAGVNFSSFHVIHISSGSPADRAGLKSGDIIRKLNGLSAKSLSVEKIQKRLRAKPDKLIKMQILRGFETIDVEFRLRDLI